MKQAIFPQPGSATNPNDFVGRVSVTEQAQRLLARRVHLLLVDPRRMGKTYWLKTFCARTTDFETVFVDYEAVGTRDDFLRRTIDELSRYRNVWGRAMAALGHLYEFSPEVEIAPVRIKAAARTNSPVKVLEQTVLAIDGACGDKPLLICMDELPVAIGNIVEHEGQAEAREVLQTLRKLRQQTTNIRWIAGGSVGFHHTLRLAGATEGDINDLESLPLGPLPQAEAKELVERLMLGIGRRATKDATRRLIEVSGGIPFLLHQLARMLEDSSGRVTVEKVDECFDGFVRDRDKSRASTHLLTRLEKYYGGHVKEVDRILDYVALNPGAQVSDVAGDPDITRNLLDLLLDDHYLVEDNAGCYSWKYEVLRVIWVQRRGIGRRS